MKKFSILIITILVSTSLSYGAGDFYRFDYLGGNNQWSNNNLTNEINSSLNGLQREAWQNPYVDTMYSNPLNKILNFKNSILPNGTTPPNYNINNDKYSYNKIQDRDLEYLLSRMERNKFGRTYNDINIENRIDKLDTQIFGAIQSGDYKTRLNRLKHAFSAESSRNYKAKRERVNKFKEMFSAGGPTSIPTSEDYYSSLNNNYHSW